MAAEMINLDDAFLSLIRCMIEKNAIGATMGRQTGFILIHGKSSQ